MTSHDTRPIFVTGFMASGKTTVGRELAELLGWAFVDTDSLVEQRERRSVERIFAESGEEYFRTIEAEILRSHGGRPCSVVATGGGAFLNARQRRWMSRQGRTVWLDLPFRTVLARLQAGRGRPLSRLREGMDFRAFFERRRATYALARLRIDASIGSPGEVAKRILDRIQTICR